MALKENIQTFSYEAEGGAMDAYTLVMHSTSNPRAVKAATAAAKVAGVLLFSVAAAGRACTVVREGIVQVKAGGNVTVGQALVAGTGGKAIAGGAGIAGFATAITAGSDGAIIEAQWGPAAN